MLFCAILYAWWKLAKALMYVRYCNSNNYIFTSVLGALLVSLLFDDSSAIPIPLHFNVFDFIILVEQECIMLLYHKLCFKRHCA